MRIRALVACCALAACASRDQPYRFASPMLGMAQVPPDPLRPAPPAAPSLDNRDPMPPEAHRPGPAAPRRIASAAAATAVAGAPAAQPEARHQLPAPHRLPADSLAPPVRSPEELRALVGRRDRRDPVVAAVGWARELGIATEGTTGAELVAWADAAHRLAPVRDAGAGDLLVFDHTTGDAPLDLVAIVIGRDARGVIELVYLGGGIVRRGFVDPARPALRRDGAGAVVNTYLRHGKRQPPKGTHYLAGELLSRRVRVR